jgi:hypothetical protein
MKLSPLKDTKDSFLNQLDDVELTNSYFQQDSTIAHTARTAINCLEVFPGTVAKLIT